MRKPNNYESTQAQGEFTPVELGGHTLVIKQVEERMSKTNKPSGIKKFWEIILVRLLISAR